MGALELIQAPEKSGYERPVTLADEQVARPSPVSPRAASSRGWTIYGLPLAMRGGLWPHKALYNCWKRWSEAGDRALGVRRFPLSF